MVGTERGEILVTVETRDPAHRHEVVAALSAPFLVLDPPGRAQLPAKAENPIAAARSPSSRPPSGSRTIMVVVSGAFGRSSSRVRSSSAGEIGLVRKRSHPAHGTPQLSAC